MEKKKTREEYKQLYLSYKSGFKRSMELNYEMLDGMRRSFLINICTCGLWLIMGIFWGLSI